MASEGMEQALLGEKRFIPRRDDIRNLNQDLAGIPGGTKKPGAGPRKEKKPRQY